MISKRSPRLLGYALRALVVAKLLVIAAALPRIASAADVHGDPGISPDSPPGVYIWQSYNGDWYARLVAGGTVRTFDGVFSATTRITNVNPIANEWDDKVGRPANEKVRMDFHVDRKDVDGVNFSLPLDAALCLRRSGGTNTIYLGKDRTPAAAPIALAGPAACDPPDDGSGVYVTEAYKGQWRIRLQSYSNFAEFAGVIETTQPFDWHRGVLLEGLDHVRVESDRKISMELETWPGGVDGVDVSVSPGVGACLRSATKVESSVRLKLDSGETVLLTTPVDLTGNGACGAPAGAPTIPANSRKKNTGHYISLIRNDDTQIVMSESMAPGIKGFKKRYTWRELEPTEGKYDFQEIKSDLEYLASQGLSLIVMIEDKTFLNEQPLPDYLAMHTAPNRAGGYTAIRWNWTYAQRLVALFEALGAAFDSNPYFEGVAVQESALSLPGYVLDQTGYTPEKYKDRLIFALMNGADAMPKSRIFWFMNFFPRRQGYIPQVAYALASRGVVVGGPDILPDNYALNTHTYPFYRQLSNSVLLHGTVSPPGYHHSHKDSSKPTRFWTPWQVFWFSKNELNLDYMFWARHPRKNFWDSYKVDDAHSVFTNHPKINQ